MSPVDPFRDAEASSSIQEKVCMLVFPSSPEKESGVYRFCSIVECLPSKSTMLGLVPVWLEVGGGLNDDEGGERGEEGRERGNEEGRKEERERLILISSKVMWHISAVCFLCTLN